MNLDFDNPEVQANMYYAVSELCFQSGLPIAGTFMQVQGHKASDAADLAKQDDLLRKLEVNSMLLLEHKAA